MKKLYALSFSAVLSLSLNAQSFSSPESVEFDNANNRWIVGQNGSGEIHIYSPGSSTLLPFASGLTTGPHGIEQLGNVIYACDGGYIRGYDASNGTSVFTLNVGATFLNGLTSDGGHFLFATDFTAKKIYRINTLTTSYNLMTTTVKTPNGIVYDGANNRCVFVTWGSNAPIQAMSLADSSITTVLATSLSNCDGITRDPNGYWYVTSWGTNALNMVDPGFTSAPVGVMSGLTSPADIDITTSGDSIGIPNSGSANNVVFYAVPLSSKNVLATEQKLYAYPNPASDRVNLAFDNAVINGTIELLDLNGKVLRAQAANGYAFYLDRGALAAGVYVVKLRDNEGNVVALRKVCFQ
jgi:hypothetical protein